MAHEKEREFIERLREVCKKHHTMAILSDEAIADFLSTLPEEKEEDEWISVEKEMPYEYVRVIVLLNDGYTDIAFINSSGKFSIDIQERSVTHWMPLPEVNPLNH